MPHQYKRFIFKDGSGATYHLLSQYGLLKNKDLIKSLLNITVSDLGSESFYREVISLIGASAMSTLK